MAPTLSMVVSSPYVPPVPWNVSLAKTGRTTEKLKAKSPTTDIMRRGSQSCWRPAAYRNPSLTPRRPAGAGPPAWRGRMTSRAAMTAR